MRRSLRLSSDSGLRPDGRQRRRESQEELSDAQRADARRAFDAADHNRPLPRHALEGLGQGGEKTPALGQASGIPHRLPPGAVDGEQDAVGRAGGGGLDDSGEQVGQFALTGDRRLTAQAAEGSQSDERDPGEAGEEQQSGQGRGTGPEGGYGRQAHGQEKKSGSDKAQQIEASLAYCAMVLCWRRPQWASLDSDSHANHLIDHKPGRRRSDSDWSKPPDPTLLPQLTRH